jgi:hypothetical protein
MRVRVTAPAGLNVRAAPSIESAKVGSLRYQFVIKVDGKLGDWFHVGGNIKGWVSGQWLEMA